MGDIFMKMKAFIIGLVAVVVIGGGGYLVLHKSPSKTATSALSSPSTQSRSASPATSVSDTISFDGSQFSPATLTVKSGTKVTIKNTSTMNLQMDSNPHPVHSDDTDLNVGLISAGQSKTFTLTKTGSFGYHNHLDPSVQGKITIE